MTTQQEHPPPEWLVIGAEVVCYSSGSPSQVVHAKRCKVAKIATRSFTVDDPKEPRFRIDRMSVSQGGTWGWTRHVAPLESPEAQRVLEEELKRRLVGRARNAVDAWVRHPTQENRLNAITALQAVRD